MKNTEWPKFQDFNICPNILHVRRRRRRHGRRRRRWRRGYSNNSSALKRRRAINWIPLRKIVAAFRGTHVSPAKHSFGKCDRKVWQTDRQTDRRTDRRRTKWSLCVAMLRRRHKNLYSIYNRIWPILICWLYLTKLKLNSTWIEFIWPRSKEWERWK